MITRCALTPAPPRPPAPRRAYLAAVHLYRARAWACKFTGAEGLTYEEAAASERRVAAVAARVPPPLEAAALRTVHHSVRALDTQCEALAAAAAATAGAAPLDAPLARAWLAAVADAEPVAGGAFLWRVKEYWRAREGLPAELPPELAESLRPARARAGAGGADALAADFVLGGDDGGAAAEPAADAADEDADFDLAMALQEQEEEGDEEEEEGGEGGSDGGGASDASDEYRPTRFGDEAARGRGRGGRGRGRGRWAAAAAAAAPAGRGRGRWGRGGAAAGAATGLLATPSGSAAPAALAADAAADPTALAVDAAEPADAAAAEEEAGLPPVESLEEVERRFAPGSIKAAALALLREAGAGGLAIAEIAEGIQARGLKAWDEARQARNSVASTCGGDPAFARVAPGRFALRCLVPPKALRALAAAGGGGAGGAGGGAAPGARSAAGALSALDAARASALAELEARRGALTERNSFKCPRCHRAAHAAGSPLVLCDACPRAFHAACLGLELAALPRGEWACPKCEEATAATLRRVADLERRREEAADRAAARAAAAADRDARRGAPGAERPRRPSAAAAAAGAGAGGAAAGPGGPPGRRRYWDDFEALEDERSALARLDLRVRELRDLAARAAAGGAAAPQQQLPPLAPAILASGGLSAAASGALAPHEAFALAAASPADARARAEAAAAAAARLRAAVDGPPLPEPLLPPGAPPAAAAALAEALNVAEFVALYGSACEVVHEPSAAELLAAAAAPAAAAPDLAPLYTQLLLCALLEQLNRDPPAKGRARRWTRVLSVATFPEILRRYLLTTRAAPAAGAGGEGEEEEEDEEEGGEAEVRSPSKPARAPAAPVAVAADADAADDADADPMALDDRGFALWAAAALGRGAWTALPPGAHLRLLSLLCYDVAQGHTLRNDIAARAAPPGAAAAAAAKAAAARRRKAGKRKRKMEPEPEPEPAALDDGGGDGGEGDAPAAAGSADDGRAFRAEPLGADREWRRYWWLRGAPELLLVESADGALAGAVTSRAGLAALAAGLLERAPREGALAEALRQRGEALAVALEAAPGGGLAPGAYDVDALSKRPGGARAAGALWGGAELAAAAGAPPPSAATPAEAAGEARTRLEATLAEAAESGAAPKAPFAALRAALATAAAPAAPPAALAEWLLAAEAALAAAGEGLPAGADAAGVAPLLGAEDAAALPPVLVHFEGEAEGADAAAVEAAAPKPEPMDAADADAATVVTGGTAAATGATAAAAPAPLRPVSPDSELDDSDAEHVRLRERRMRRPARLWRSGRERAAWLKAALAAARVGGAAAVQRGAYLAAILADRAGPLVERHRALAADAAKWEAAEAARAAAEAAGRPAPGAPAPAPQAAEPLGVRPLMLRSGKSKTGDGLRVVLKLLGRDPFPPARGAGSEAGAPPSEEAAAACRWSLQCSVCLLAGDLLCCEHPDACAVSAHAECAGALPAGMPWICPNHDARGMKARLGKRRARAPRRGGDASEDDSEEGGGAEVRGERASGRLRKARAAAAGGSGPSGSDSEATVSAADSDSEATR